MRANTSNFIAKGPTTRDRVQQALRQQFRLGVWNASDHRWREAIACEVLRNTIWSLWAQRGMSAESTVNRLTIRALAMPTIRLVSEPGVASLEHKALLDQCFKQLELLGDVEAVGRSVVAPVSSRLVHMWNDDYLLVGGLPTHEAERRTGVEIRRLGPSRWLTLCRKQVQALADVFPEQSIASWMQRTPIPLAEHRQRMLDLPRNNALDPTIQETCKAYVPDLSAGKSLTAWSQMKRWREISRIQGTRVSLIGFRPPNSGATYAIGLIENGRVASMSEPFTNSRTSRSDDVRLFQFAEDQAAGYPFCIREIDDTTIELDSSLPEPETRLLHALASRTREDTKVSSWQRWRFERSNAMTFWTSRLQWMGISVRSQEPNR